MLQLKTGEHAHILQEDEQCNILFPDKCFRIVHRRGHQNLKEWIASSRIKGQRSEGRVGHEEEDPGCKKCGNCGKKTQGKKRACGIYSCQVMEEGDSFASKVTGERYKFRENINCESKNVIYLVECKSVVSRGSDLQRILNLEFLIIYLTFS